MPENTQNHEQEKIEEMERYSISFDGEKYKFGQHRYNKLEDAVTYAKNHDKINQPTHSAGSEPHSEYSNQKEKEMVEYDPSVIRGFADELYRRANTIVIVNAVIFGLIGAMAGGVTKGVGVAIIVGLVGAGIGYYLGLQKAFMLKLQAQTALCQIKIEENTSKNT